jgi:arsenite methyltransferase
VIYRGTVPELPDRFVLDKHHDIQTGKVFPVCGNSWRMLHDTRFRAHFEFIGDFTRHYGLFEGCGDAIPYDTISAAGSGLAGACC